MSNSSTQKSAIICGRNGSTRPLADLFEMQDEIVAHVSNALTAQITKTEARRAQRVSSPDAMDHYFQGMAWFNMGPDHGQPDEGAGMFRMRLDGSIPIMSGRLSAWGAYG